MADTVVEQELQKGDNQAENSQDVKSEGTSAAVKLVNITKSFGAVHANTNVSLRSTSTFK